MRRGDLPADAAERLSGWLRGYRKAPGVPDELFDSMGRPRDHWLSLLAGFAEYPEDEFNSRFSLATRHIRDTGVSYRIYGDERERIWPLNPLPLLLGEAEWSQIVAGVEQRARLMEALLQDLYSDARIVTDGALPAAALTGSIDFVRQMQGVKPVGGRYLQLYAADLGRGPDGRWWVLGDRTQAPSGIGYALENRLVVSRAFPNLYNTANVERLAPFFNALRENLAGSADRVDPRIALLTPGPYSQTYFEQAHIARYLGLLLLEGEDLVVRDGRVYVRTIAGLKRVDVILRRVDADYLDPLELNSASHLGVPGLLQAIRAGGVTVLNAPGTGVLESKALLGFLPRLSRRLLGEELMMPHVATWWCGQAPEYDFVRGNFDRLAIAPAFEGAQSRDARIVARAAADLSPAERAAMLQHLADRPGDFVGQEVVQLSTTPVLRDGQLQAAPFVMRVFAISTPEGIKIMPGGFCRTSDRGDVRALSMGDDARSTDVWVLAERPVERMTLLANSEEVRIRRVLGHLPSRAADNLFWLGRYLERAEATVRLARSLCSSLMDPGGALRGTGETLEEIQRVLADWNALDEEAHAQSPAQGALGAAWSALHDPNSHGSAIQLVRAARRATANVRERLSADFWTLLLNLESGLAVRAQTLHSEAEALQRVESALQTLAALSGLSQENMNRGHGWRFLDMGRRIERGVNACRFASAFAHDGATIDDLDLLLDLSDSQISYRARYLVGVALRPVRDMVVLDPYNTRSLAFQVMALKAHVDALPTLLGDGVLEEPVRLLIHLAAAVETGDAADLDTETLAGFERTLLKLSDAISERYFLRGARAAPTVKFGELA